VDEVLRACSKRCRPSMKALSNGSELQVFFHQGLLKKIIAVI